MKYPDTRNKLDSNKGIKNSTVTVKKKSTKITMGDLRANVKTENKEKSPIKLTAEKKPSKGSLFKKRIGYSKTMKKNMKKRGVLTVAEYRLMRKARKLAATKIRQKKHSDSVAYKRANGKKAKGKKAITVPKKEQK